MKQFPNPISLPESILRARNDRKIRILRSSWRGVGIRMAIIFGELLGVWWFSSHALFMDAVASFMDVLSTLLLIGCIKLAEKPPDRNHPFGHGRFEPLFGLQLGLFLVFVGAGMFIQQSFDMTTLSNLNPPMDSRAWIIPALAVLLLEGCYHVVNRTAKEENSPALAVDAVHYRVDALTSLFAAVALLCAPLFPEWSLVIDRMGALLIAAFMIGVGVIAAKNNANQLMDRVPEDSFFQRVRSAAKRVEGVLGTEKIRIQMYGPDAHVDIDVEVNPQLTVDVAHLISQKVRLEIQREWPAVRDVIVHLEPFYPNDH